MAARVGVKPTTLRLKVIVSTNVPHVSSAQNAAFAKGHRHRSKVTTIHQRSPPHIRGHHHTLKVSEVTTIQQRSPPYIKGHHHASKVTTMNQRSPPYIKGHHHTSKVTTIHQRSPPCIKGQSPSYIEGHHHNQRSPP